MRVLFQSRDKLRVLTMFGQISLKVQSSIGGKMSLAAAVASVEIHSRSTFQTLLEILDDPWLNMLLKNHHFRPQGCQMMASSS